MNYLMTLIVAAFLGLIPATIAKNKGYSFGLWWFYGWMLFIVAIIHVCCIPDKNNNASIHTMPTPVVCQENAVKSGFSSENEKIKALKGYKELLDSGVITREEFEKKKTNILN